MPDRFAEDMPASSPIGALLTAVMRQGLAAKDVQAGWTEQRVEMDFWQVGRA